MAAIEPKLTVDDLALLPDDGKRYELHEGELLVSSVPSLFHQRIVTNSVLELGLYLRQNPVGQVVTTPGVIFDPFEAFIPDLVYISHERLAQIEHGGRLHGAPELIVEILSPGNDNRRRDEVIKRQTYGKFGVDEYWIVDGEARMIAQFRLHNGVLQPTATFHSDDSMWTSLLPNFTLAVGNIFTT
jgi:Uma2 family endonuclease